jgi:predicted  nucleic acid-binding Zn-ribbon protein
MPGRGEPEGELTTWVCVTCGNELYSRGGETGRLVCPRCGGAVFRPFDSPSARDEVARDFLESTARHLDLGDADPDTRSDDRRDLGRQ